MAIRKTCEDCAAFAALTKECRRKSPVAIAVPQPNGQMGAMSMWPPTRAEFWCQEFVLSGEVIVN